MYPIRFLASVLFLLLLPHGGLLMAQGPERSGLHVSFGIGGGAATIDCSQCGELLEDDPWSGGLTSTLYVGAGYALRPNMLVGAEVNAWADYRISPGNYPETRGMSLDLRAAMIQYHPVSSLPLYLKDGIGLARVTLSDGAEQVQGAGWGMQTGVGFDVQLTRSLAFTPFIHALQLRVGSTRGTIREVAVESPSNPRFIHAGIALHYY